MGGAFNKVILIGYLGKNPETRTLENGTLLCRFSMATSEVFKNRQTGEKWTHTEWHNIILWRGLAEIAEKHLHKGDKVLIEGRIRSRSWEDRESGQTKFITEIIAKQLQMMGSKKIESANNDQTEEPNLKSFIQESPIELEEDLPF
ncbi:MAG: single-stranded DNA-binding protein [Flavobacteriales bacterium]|nr:single-stranded DNA-binding protein [Flavobacteriales bacterium]|tara:strand:+ start:11757 stop:12194 length:438 start_codon:yes stop_codon:yes gene_type:complete